MLQLDIEGDTIEMRLWKPGEPMASAPAISIADTRYRSGQVSDAVYGLTHCLLGGAPPPTPFPACGPPALSGDTALGCASSPPALSLTLSLVSAVRRRRAKPGRVRSADAA